MKLNGIELEATRFAYEGCHKIYIIKDEEEASEALSMGYNLYSIDELEEVFEESCGLRFISSWDLENRHVKQFEEAIFN